MYTFLKLKPGTNPADLESKFPSIIEKYNPELAENNRKDVLSLQPILDIHLTSDLAEEPEPNGDQSIVNFLSLIGFLVLLIAWINYVNLSTARAMERAREVGVRKVSGALKGQLISQFLVESGLVNLVSISLAFGMTAASLPWFNSLTGLQLEIVHLLQPWSLMIFAGLWFVGTFLSGLYPAWVLSSFRPVTVLKGQFKNTSGGMWLRKGLVVLQFAASVALIAGTIIIYRQLDYMLNRDIGVNIEQVLVVERPGIAPRDRQARNSAVDVFRAELAKSPDIQGIAASVTIPGKQREYKANVHKFGSSQDEAVTIRFNSMDYNFMDVFEMKLIAGREFSPEFTSDQDTSVILTESAVKRLGFEKPADVIGQTVSIPMFQWNPIVVGVVNDYNQVSLKKAVDPTIFYCSPFQGEYYSMRVNTNNLSNTIEHANKAWEAAFPGNPFDYFFLDDYFNIQYQNEQRFGKLAMVFALLAILVGCLGLFGLSGYSITQRTKEIGIRKVLGATTPGLVTMLSTDMLKLVGIAILLSAPLAWWAMENWLQNFAYRIDMEWWIFVVAGILAVLTAFLTVSFQSVKAALANPIESLRSE
jgi:putative ABC transport system permease protein